MDRRASGRRTSNSTTALLLLTLLVAYSWCCCCFFSSSGGPSFVASAAFLGPLPASTRMLRALSYHQQQGMTAARFLLSTQHRARLSVTAALATKASTAGGKAKKASTASASTTTTRKKAAATTTTATKAKPKAKATTTTTKKAAATTATKARTSTSKASAAAAAGGEDDGMKPGMKLIIVESATKANTIKRFLTSGKGKGEWEVDYCMGHVRELPRTAADMPPTAKKEKNKVHLLILWVRVCSGSAVGIDGFVPKFASFPCKPLS